MKVEEVTKITCHTVEVEGEDNLFTRWDETSWTQRFGESDEPIYDTDKVKRLEKAFQEYITSK